MNIKRLEYFMVVCECSNITEAAEKLHMAQPPLSRALKSLEEDLDTTLFFRSNKGIQLTDAGRLLYKEASHLLRKIDNIQTIVKESSKGLCGNIKIGACYSTLPIVTEKMNVFFKHHNSCTFSVVHGKINELETWLRDGSIDVLFLRNCIVENSYFVHVTLPDDPLQLVIHKSLDNCLDKKMVDIAYLKNLPLCLLDEKQFPSTNDTLKRACDAAGFAPKIVCTCYDNSVGLALALSGMVATFLPVSSLSMNQYPDLNVKTLIGLDLSSNPTMIYNPNIYHSQSLEAFLALFC